MAIPGPMVRRGAMRGFLPLSFWGRSAPGFDAYFYLFKGKRLQPPGILGLAVKDARPGLIRVLPPGP